MSDDESDDVESILEQIRHISDPIELGLRDLSASSESIFDPEPWEWLELAMKAEIPIPENLKSDISERPSTPQSTPQSAIPSEKTLYSIIRALTLALVKAHPDRLLKDGRPLLGYVKKSGELAGIVGFLMEGKFTDLKTTALEYHIGRALEDD